MWTELNDRQQGTLAIIYDLDAENESDRKRAAARGDWDRTPAAQWRQIDFAHDPSDRRLVGWTELQLRLSGQGWDSQGNGATMAALTARKLITRAGRPTLFGTMGTVTLTRAGRAAARAGLDIGTARTAALSARSWEVLALLWAADRHGAELAWGFSRTIQFVLIDKHDPPLATSTGTGYRLTDHGRDYYRQHYGTHVTAHPHVDAPHPDGAAAEPWPARVDEILDRYRARWRALCSAWRATATARETARAEADLSVTGADSALPAEAASLVAARRDLWASTARQRAELAAEHATLLHTHTVRAARAYTVAALHTYTAAVTATNPLTTLTEPGDTGDEWDEQRLLPPPETGVYALDSQISGLYAAAVGKPRRRRGPAPKHRAASIPLASDPGHELAELARTLHGHLAGGALLRLLHPTTVDASRS